MATQTRTPAQTLALVEAMTNRHIAAFLVAEFGEHKVRVEAEANGSLLVVPRMTIVQQHIFQLCEVHGLDQPAPARTPGPPGDHDPGGPR